jgi:hypothetical protein
MLDKDVLLAKVEIIQRCLRRYDTMNKKGDHVPPIVEVKKRLD